MNAHRPGAVLWDMDGTLVDTEPIWLAAQSGLVDRYGLPPLTPEQDALLVGQSLWTSAALFQSLGVPGEARAIIDEVSRDVITRIRHGVEWRPGARELLRDLAANGIPTALVTNSGRGIVEAILGGLDDHTFDVVVTADDVTHGKPHPEPFLLAARLLGVDARECVVLEDSLHGLGGAIAAECVAIGIPHSLPLEPTAEFLLRETLAGVGWSELVTWFVEHRTSLGARMRPATSSAPAAEPGRPSSEPTASTSKATPHA